MKYKKLTTLTESEVSSALVSGSRSRIARLLKSTRNKADRREVLRRCY